MTVATSIQMHHHLQYRLHEYAIFIIMFLEFHFIANLWSMVTNEWAAKVLVFCDEWYALDSWSINMANKLPN